MPPRARTSTTRKPATRKPAAKKPASTGSPGVLQLDRPEAAQKFEELLTDREPLFSVGGVEYTIPKNVPPAWALEAWHINQTLGFKEAVFYAVTKMIDEDGWAALKNCETLVPGDVEAISMACINKIMPGGPPVPKAQ